MSSTHRRARVEAGGQRRQRRQPLQDQGTTLVAYLSRGALKKRSLAGDSSSTLQVQGLEPVRSGGLV
ncbi:hypothetical protein NDU88_003143 [Pleurodeles waltl]|uniref:Uncharacterized protein n=1 Tax=Pleurodeles waltl TaxID=8319 RepID=A0AAV7MUS9_PLEWA|nr:hypothetical protein NDU88_003143 [Pleurodeles waltl]